MQDDYYAAKNYQNSSVNKVNSAIFKNKTI